MIEKGLVQIYTGNGKGKTTPSFGLALRAAGAGNNVVIYQFLKPPSLHLGERQGIEKSNLSITVRPLDIKWDMRTSLQNPDDIARAQKTIAEICDKIAAEARDKIYDVIIMDEIVFCLSKNIVRLEWIENIIKNKHPNVELVLTGRGATEDLIAMADLVTEMKLIKHPYDKGISARKGIEY